MGKILYTLGLGAVAATTFAWMTASPRVSDLAYAIKSGSAADALRERSAQHDVAFETSLMHCRASPLMTQGLKLHVEGPGRDKAYHKMDAFDYNGDGIFDAVQETYPLLGPKRHPTNLETFELSNLIIDAAQNIKKR